MKKYIYAVLISLTALAFNACTEEQIEPTTKDHPGGGSGSTDPGA